MKARLVGHDKTTDEDGNTIEIKIWQVQRTKDRPHGYKYSLVYIVNGERVIGYDNAEGKGDHRHYRDHTEPYQFKDLRTLANDFYKNIARYKEGKI